MNGDMYAHTEVGALVYVSLFPLDMSTNNRDGAQNQNGATYIRMYVFHQ